MLTDGTRNIIRAMKEVDGCGREAREEGNESE
jgi:hypothetical protein